MLCQCECVTMPNKRCHHGKRKTDCRRVWRQLRLQKDTGSARRTAWNVAAVPCCKAHGKREAYCGKCGGIAFCEHGKQKAQRRECGGKTICHHGKHRHHCADCNNCPCTIEGGPLYGHRFAGVSNGCSRCADSTQESRRR